MKETDINVLYEYFRKVEILEDKVNLAQERGSLQAVLSTIEENIEEVDTYKANDIAIIGAGDFGVAIAESFKTKLPVPTCTPGVQVALPPLMV